MHNNITEPLSSEKIKHFFEEKWNDTYNWLVEPIRAFFNSNSPECLWIPFFVILSTAPIFFENTNTTNRYDRMLYNLLLVYFSSYISNKIPYTIMVLKRLFNKFLCKNKYQNNVNETEKTFDHIGCSQIRTLFAIILFIFCIYMFNTEYFYPYHYFIILFISLLFLYRSIFYILQSFTDSPLPPDKEMEAQIFISREDLNIPKKGVSIIK